MNKKVVLITGSTKGIGFASTREFLKKGYTVIGVSRNDLKDDLESIKGYLNYFHYKGDVTDEKSVKLLFEFIKDKYGRLDVLVNNVGKSAKKPFVFTTGPDYQEALNTNLGGSVFCSRYALKMMVVHNYGRIINISSIAGENGLAFEALYSMAKSSLTGFTKAIAKEYGKKGITCNAVAPGVIQTDQTLHTEVLGQIPVNRVGTTREVAKLILYLASENAGYITGQVIHIDGGLFI